MEQDYDYMYDYLNKIKKTRCLTIYEDAILTLVGDYIELLNGNNLENTENKGDNLIEAIKYKNYRFADFICKNCEEYKNHKDEIGIISILLNDIIIYIDKNKNTLKRIN